MKKKYLTLALLLCIDTCIMSMQAQSIDKASASHERFNQLLIAGIDQQGIYEALYQCYKEYVAVLDNAQSNTPAYVQAKNALRELWPYLQAGAAYNSNHDNQQSALLFAQAYIDVTLMKAYQNEQFVRDEHFPTMAYFAASGTFNARNYDKAIDYFRVYLDTGDVKNRQNVFAYMAKACMNIKNHDLAMSVLNEATNDYPKDFNMLSMAINNCIEREDNTNLQYFITKAIALKPNDETLLNIQGKLYEDTQQFQKALNIYSRMRQMRPNSLNVVQHIALNYYNLGVMHYNKASMEQNESQARKLTRQANEFFSAAATTLQDIIANDPTSTKYMLALATVYSCLGDQTQLDAVNSKLSSIGSRTVAANVTPALMTYSNKSSAQSNAQSANLAVANTQTVEGNAPVHQYSPDEAPLYSKFAKEYVETRLRKWQSKDSYETIEEYHIRVNETTRDAEVERLKKAAEADYIKTYTQRIRFNDLLLKPYDAENRVFLVESKYGELIVPVPRENNEAKVFESSWSGMQFKNPKFYINNDKLMLSSLTFVTPTGNTYRYEGDKGLNYAETVVDVSFDPIDSSTLVKSNLADNQSYGSRIKRQTVKVGTASSDVDKDIPQSRTKNDRTFAVIIANENYDMVAHVPMALNDGETFSQYCKKTLGLPDNNIRFYRDASFGVMIRAMRDIKDIASAYSGDIQVIFYYAGHGIPNETTKDAFLLPVDADGTQTEGCYSLNRLYSELGNLDARSIVVFLDACFSGANRDGGMLASARGVALKAKDAAPKGNMVVFSAASSDETAFPYKEKGHGLFTYFLLKKLQESKGDATLQELGDYISRNVKQQSVVVNRKTQTPTIIPSSTLTEGWKKLKLNEVK